MIFKIISIIFKIMERHWLVNETRKTGLLFYLKFLQATRKSLVGILFLFFAFQIFILASVGLVIAGLYLAPIEYETKMWILFYACLAIVFVFSFVLIYAFSEKTWFKYSGAKELLSK
ncbi:MAG: hypothetical protein JNL11_12605 [Bdellovibrionaceae bacterium]|nr:hypothetical protein [Pseudobdellovibrionaceae bacterium]